MRALAGERAAWGATEHLLAHIYDAVAAGNWQRGGKPQAPRPEPIPRPGDERVGLSTDETRRRLHDLAERERARKARR